MQTSQPYMSFCWDDTESVLLESSKRGGFSQTYPIKIAKGRAIHGRAKSPSEGTYAGYERNWHFETVMLPNGLSPKPGDAIIQKDKTRWVILSVDNLRNGYHCQCGTVNLVLALDLRDTVDIERASIAYTDAGVKLKNFPPASGGTLLYSGVAAQVQLLNEDVIDQRGLRGFKGDYAVTVGIPTPLVTSEDRIRWTDTDGISRYLDIKAVKNPDRIDELWVIDAELRP